jgi:geranylgeranyl diphosphate synthase type II
MKIAYTSASMMPDSAGEELTPQSDIEQSSDSQHLLHQVRNLMQKCLSDVMQGPAREASEYQIKSGGSLLRARLALISGAAFGCPLDYRVAAAAACELVHNASLVHDDLCDGDPIRRNNATVWKRYGEGVAVCSGDLLLCAAFSAACQVKDPGACQQLTRLVASLTSDVIVGQSLEIAPASNGDRPRFRQYLKATRAKTVPLIQLPLISGLVISHDKAPIRATVARFAEAIGLAYQILDDLDDLTTQHTDLHLYHAFHHHRVPGRDRRDLRIHRAVRHAMAALQRARQQLSVLTTMTPCALDGQLTTLIEQLHTKALQHGRINPYKESVSDVPVLLKL